MERWNWLSAICLGLSNESIRVRIRRKLMGTSSCPVSDKSSRKAPISSNSIMAGLPYQVFSDFSLKIIVARHRNHAELPDRIHFEEDLPALGRHD